LAQLNDNFGNQKLSSVASSSNLGQTYQEFNLLFPNRDAQAKLASTDADTHDMPTSQKAPCNYISNTELKLYQSC
jgi:hypothetical protein